MGRRPGEKGREAGLSLGLGLGLGVGLHEEPGGAVRGGPASLIEVPDTGASWGAAWRVRLDASARGQYGNAASRSVAVERTCMGFLLRRAEPADPTPIPNPERSVLDRHPSTTVGAQHHAWSEACLAFGLKKRTLDDRKTERDVLLVTFHPLIPMPDITLMIQVPIESNQLRPTIRWLRS